MADPIKPSDLLVLMRNNMTIGPMAVDTETSGLFEDDGARISTVSLAFKVPDKMFPILYNWAGDDRITLRVEDIAQGHTAMIASIAWPVDQGRDGKPEAHGATPLWPEAENLPDDEWDILLRILNQHSLIMHNSKFDCHKFRVGLRTRPDTGIDLMDRVAWDTQNVNDLLWGWEKTGLKSTAARLWGKEWEDESAKVSAYLKKAKLPAGRWDLVPWDVIGPYADTDARLTLMLYLRQQHEIHHMGGGSWLGDHLDVISTAHRRLDVTRMLYRMENKGIPYDQIKSKLTGFECEERAKKIARKLPFSPPTVNKAKHYWFGEEAKGGRGMIPYSTTEGGQPQLTAEIVARMVEDGVEHARTWAEYVKVTDAASMWYHGYADKVGVDGRLRTSFRQNGTRSSRFSVERVNLQAIPANYKLGGYASLEGLPTPRDLIASAVPEGWAIWELDLMQAELRVAALMAKCQPMLDMMERGQDLHDYTTQALFNMDKSHPEWDRYRQVGKRANFSLCFGSGARTFDNMISKEAGMQLGERECRRIVTEWNGLYPEFHDAIQRHMDTVVRRQLKFQNGWVSYKNGERRWFQQYEDAHKAFNQRVQGNLAQYGIDWLLFTDHYLRQMKELEEANAGLILAIHDSQVLLLPDSPLGQRIAERCAGFANDLWQQWFPGVGGGSSPKRWG